jgi:hypothetical protein
MADSTKTTFSPSSGDLGKTLERLYKLAVIALAAPDRARGDL